jgi:AcrR family transcriptional regulator
MNVLDSAAVRELHGVATSGQSRARRSDAIRNERAVLDAAEQVFSADGALVPLARIARAAGVGRATLQRHFADRYALAAAVYGRGLEEVEQFASDHCDQPGILDDVVRRVVDGQRRAAGLFPMMRAAPEAEALVQGLGARLERLLTPLVTVAVARGELAADVTARDVELVLAMAEGLLGSYDGDELGPAIDRGLEIAMAGLRSRPPDR